METQSEHGATERASWRPYIILIVGLAILAVAIAALIWDNDRMDCDAPGAVTPQSWSEWHLPEPGQSE